MKRSNPDPEFDRWRRTYPRFPGVAKCVELLRSPNVQGAWIDIICQELTKHANEYPEELVSETRKELQDSTGVGKTLLGVLADARLIEAQPLFEALLGSEDTTLHKYGLAGLKSLDTKQTRSMVWKFENG